MDSINRTMITRILSILLISCLVGLAAAPPILRQIFTTNAAGNANQFSQGASTASIKSGVFVTNVDVNMQTNRGNILFATDGSSTIGTAASRAGNYFGAGFITNAGGITNGGVILSGSTIFAGANVTAAAGSSLNWNGRSAMKSPSDGVITFWNAGQSDLNRLQFGGTTAGFPSLGLSNGNLRVLGADGLFGSQATNGFISDGGVYYPSNGNMNITIITAGMKNGDCWLGMLSNRLQAVFLTNGTAVFKVIGP